MEKIPDELGFVLHDRSTCGEVLTTVEEQQLEAWYAVRDAAEAMWLNPVATDAPDLVGLQGQLDQTLAELQAVTQRIQQVSMENLELRREIAGLYQRLELPRSA
jgi:hypothetical protein